MDLCALALLAPELRVTVIDALSGLRYELQYPMQPQSIAIPERMLGGDNG